MKEVRLGHVTRVVTAPLTQLVHVGGDSEYGNYLANDPHGCSACFTLSSVFIEMQRAASQMKHGL